MRFSTHKFDYKIASSGYIDPVLQKPFRYFVCEACKETRDDLEIATGRFVLDEVSGELYYQEDQFNPLTEEDCQLLSAYIKSLSLPIADQRRCNCVFSEMTQDYQLLS